MAATNVTKIATASDGGSIPLQFRDLAGDGAKLVPHHATVKADGTIINPASEETLAAVQATLAAGIAANFGAGESHIGEVGGRTIIASASFSRPADTTAYASGDLVANVTVAGSVVPLSFKVGRINAGTGRITRARLRKNGVSIASASFRLHLYKVSPTASNGDNGAWLTTESTYLGALDITMDRVFADGAKGFGVPLVGAFIAFDCAAGSQLIYGLIEARGAYAPVSGETFTATLEVDAD